MSINKKPLKSEGLKKNKVKKSIYEPQPSHSNGESSGLMVGCETISNTVLSLNKEFDVGVGFSLGSETSLVVTSGTGCDLVVLIPKPLSGSTADLVLR